MMVADTLRDFLERHGLDVSHASDIDAARTLLQRLAFDVVVLDRMLHRRDSLGLVEEIDRRHGVPVIMLTAPIPATQKALARSGLRLDEIGALEVNEAFAPVPLAWLADLGADAKALNPNGGAIALGHPLGGSGARIATTLLHHMRDHGIRYGLQTMCEGGGQANVTIIERL